VGVHTNSCNVFEEDYLDELAALEELQYLTQQCHLIIQPKTSFSSIMLSDLSVDSKPVPGSDKELQNLREENKRLKRTLSERFAQEL